MEHKTMFDKNINTIPNVKTTESKTNKDKEPKDKKSTGAGGR